MREKLAQMVIEYYSGNRRAIEVADQILKYQIEEIKKMENPYTWPLHPLLYEGFEKGRQGILRKMEEK